MLNSLLVDQQSKIFPFFLPYKTSRKSTQWFIRLQLSLQGRLRKAHILSNITQKCLFIHFMSEAHASLLLCDLIQRRDSCCIFNWYIKIAACTRHHLTSMESLKSGDQSAERLRRSVCVHIRKPYHFFLLTVIFSYCKQMFTNHLANMWSKLEFISLNHVA